MLLGNFIQKLIGFGSSDSRRLLEIFHEHATSPENTIRWHWRQGDLAMWDNYGTMHRAVDDYDELPRIMRRTTLEGVLPVSVDGRNSRTLGGFGKSEGGIDRCIDCWSKSPQLL